MWKKEADLNLVIVEVESVAFMPHEERSSTAGANPKYPQEDSDLACVTRPFLKPISVIWRLE